MGFIVYYADCISTCIEHILDRLMYYYNIELETIGISLNLIQLIAI